MAYKLYLREEDNIIISEFTSIIDNNMIISFCKDVEQFILLDKKKYLFLEDFSKVSGMTDDSKQELLKNTRKLNEFALKLAVITNKDMKMEIIHLFESTSGLSKVRIFDNIDEAISYLKE
jgi:hypothetical protein